MALKCCHCSCHLYLLLLMLFILPRTAGNCVTKYGDAHCSPLTTIFRWSFISFDAWSLARPRCSPVDWAVSWRRRCPSSTPSIFRWSCVGAPRTKAAPGSWTPSMLRTSHRCWRSGMNPQPKDMTLTCSDW